MLLEGTLRYANGEVDEVAKNKGKQGLRQPGSCPHTPLPYVVDVRRPSHMSWCHVQELQRRTDVLIRLVEKEHEDNEAVEEEQRRKVVKKPSASGRGGAAKADAAAVKAEAGGEPPVPPAGAKKRRAPPSADRPGKRRGTSAS